MTSQKNKNRWEKMAEVSDRIKRLRNAFLDTVPEITPDRARLITASYRQTEGRSQYLRRALAFQHTLENMSLYINPDELIVGSLTGQLRGVPVFPEYDSGFILEELDSFEKRIADRFVVSERTKLELLEILPEWNKHSLAGVAGELIADESWQAVKSCVFVLTALRSGVGHVVVNYERVLKNGLLASIGEAERRLAELTPDAVDYQARKEYYQASIITCQAVICLAGRYAALAQKMAGKEPNVEIKRNLLKIADNCLKVPALPAENFWEALQSLWFVHLGIQLESNGHSISLGRFDQYLYPYYERQGDKDFAEELIHCLWLKFSEVNKIRDKVSSVAFGGYPMFQHVTLGGQDGQGRSAVNPFTYLCLEATAKVGMPQPSTSLRWFFGCDEELFMHAIKVASYGTGMPAFFNDEVLIPNMLQAGYPLQQARDYSIVGCTEMSVGGISEPWLTGGFINLLKVLELTLFDGCDPVSGEQFPIRSGGVEGFASFETFLEGYFGQLAGYLRFHVDCDNILDKLHGKLLPNIFASVMIDDCMKNGKSSLEGGARFNSTTINAVGIANVADALAVIKKLVYEDKSLSWTKLKIALLADFNGYEDLRQTIINKVPKYGNDIEYVDELARTVHDFLYEELSKYRNPRGGKYLNALYSIACHALFADKVGATPDGRKRGMVLADGGVSCAQGRDLNGATALLNSVVKLDPYKAVGSTLLNIKFHPEVFSRDENYYKLAALLKTYFLMKGQHIQMNVVDVQCLRDAQRNPEKYASLVVRVAGFSVLFTTIDPSLQEDIILRTENRSGG